MGYKVFISYKHSTMDGQSVTRDYTIASELHNALTRAGVKTFFSEKDLSTGDYINEIYDALEEADIMIVVGTKSEHISSQWVKQEWSTFIAAINGKRKPNGDVYTYLEGMSVNNLPMMLYKWQSYATSEKDKLIDRIISQLGIITTQIHKESTSTIPRLNIRVWDKIPFGQYPQGAKGEVRPLIWRVLDIQGMKALLITDKVIDCVPYNTTNENVTWETCTLRKWLNKVFLRKAFSSVELSQILTVTNQNSDNGFGAKGGNPTTDRIFALSIDEANSLFLDEHYRWGWVTEYAEKQGLYIDDDSRRQGAKLSRWMLRSPGRKNNEYAYVQDTGHVFGWLNVKYGDGVRPAFWLNLS